jgi:recombinational DNA repair ATPase RecF
MRLHDEPSSTNGHYPLKDFKAGSIVSLTLENFMSTDYTKYPFNPTTNYIFGANGTGKSTIVSALFIIFDGRIAKLGRADDLSMFVNRERPNKKARITVEISTGRGTTIGIQRSWCSGKNKNTKWKMRRGDLKIIMFSISNFLFFQRGRRPSIR